MRLHGLRGVSRRRGWCVTTKRDKDHQPAPDLVQRRFEASGINQLWGSYGLQVQQAWREQLVPDGQPPEFDPDQPF